MVASDFRDVSTLGSILPDSRASMLVPEQTHGAIRHIASSDRFVCISSESGISIFPSDTPSTAIVDTTSFIQSKKGSTPLTQTSVNKPLVAFSCKGIMSSCISVCSRFIFLFTTEGISALDLSIESPEIVSLSKCKIAHGVCVQSKQDCGVLLWTENSNTRKLNSIVFSVTDDGVSMGTRSVVDIGITSSKATGDVSFGFADGLVGVVSGEKVMMYTLQSDGLSFSEPVSGSGISPQNGDVMSVIPLSGSRVIPNLNTPSGGLLIVQRDVMTVFAEDDSGKLDLVFQFRDSISKHEYLSASVDSVKPWLVCVTTEAFNNRVHLELFDLSLLKPKSVSLTPLMRFDVSRLFNRKGGEMTVGFIKSLSRMPAFIQSVVDDSTGHRIGIVWESVLRDQWYSFMPNFKVLNKNFPYVESEEEFDFNQDADLDTVCSTLNRYKKASRKLFDLVPNASKEGFREAESRDVEMVESGAVEKEFFIPLLAPLNTWKKRTSETFEAQENCKHAEFFSEKCEQILADVVRKSR